MKPNLLDVLAAVAPGRVVPLELTAEQKRTLRDPDARLALDVVRHLAGARHTLGHTGRFPLTEQTFQTIARKLGRTIGIKRSRTLIHLLIAADALNPTGSYRQTYKRTGTSGYRVALYRIRIRVCSALSCGKHPVGRTRSVKKKNRVRWWSHPLFGTLNGRPPPSPSGKSAAKLRSLDELGKGKEWRVDRSAAPCSGSTVRMLRRLRAALRSPKNSERSRRPSRPTTTRPRRGRGGSIRPARSPRS